MINLRRRCFRRLVVGLPKSLVVMLSGLLNTPAKGSAITVADVRRGKTCHTVPDNGSHHVRGLTGSNELDLDLDAQAQPRVYHRRAVSC